MMARRAPKRALRALCRLPFLFALVWLAASGAAFAHASLVAAEPQDGAVLKAPPQRLVLTFDEPVAPLVMRLVGAGGTSVTLDRVALEGATVRIDLPPGLSEGTHALSWRVVSADGHPVGGSVVFSIGAPSAGALAQADAAVDWPLRVSIWTTRSLLYGALFLGAGGLLFGGLIAPVPRRANILQSALILAGLALAASGHASAAAPEMFTRPAVFIHAVSVAFWLGAFLPLAVLFRERRPDAAAALRRFSALIPFALVPLVVSGGFLAVVQVRHIGAVPATAYGRVLAIKLVLVALLILVAAFNRWRLTRPAGAGDTKAIRRLVSAIVIESLLALAILGVVAAWRFTPPPRALEAAAAQPAHLHIHTLPAMAELSIAPGHIGPVAATILLSTGDFAPLDAKEVTLVLSHPASGIQPIRKPARRSGDGTWRIDSLTLPVAGEWRAEILILITDFKETRLDGTILIRP
jgi:copper transport protein